MANKNITIPSLDDVLEQSMRDSFIKAALLAKRTNTPLAIWRNDKIDLVKAEEIDNLLKSLPE